MTPAQFSDHVGRIYDCVSDPTRWPEAVEALRVHFGGLISTLAVLDTENNQARFGAFGGDPAVVMPLVTKYAQHMPFYRVIPKLDVDVPVGMDTVYAYAGPNSREEIENSLLGREWSIPHNVTDALCLAILKQDRRIGTFVISTTGDRPPVSQEELDQLALIAPHLRRAVTIGDLFEMETSAKEAYRSVIDHLASAVFIVRSGLRILYANPRAEELLAQAVAVRSVTGNLIFRQPMVQDAIAGAVARSERSEVSLGSLGIGVPLEQVALPLIAHVLPLALRDRGSRIVADGTAAIFITTGSSTSAAPIEAIAALFGLTGAEKRVATLIAKGKSRAEIALASGVSEQTVKSQLDAVFDKTATGNQRELEALLRSLAPPLKDD